MYNEAFISKFDSPIYIYRDDREHKQGIIINCVPLQSTMIYYSDLAVPAQAITFARELH